MLLGIMSHLGLCRLGLCRIQYCVVLDSVVGVDVAGGLCHSGLCRSVYCRCIVFSAHLLCKDTATGFRVRSKFPRSKNTNSGMKDHSSWRS